MTPQEEPRHEFENFPYGSVKRLAAAFLELTGIDIMQKEEDQKHEK